MRLRDLLITSHEVRAVVDVARVQLNRTYRPGGEQGSYLRSAGVERTQTSNLDVNGSVIPGLDAALIIAANVLRTRSKAIKMKFRTDIPVLFSFAAMVSTANVPT